MKKDKKIDELLKHVNNCRITDGYPVYVTYFRSISSKVMTLSEKGDNGIFYVMTTGRKNIIEWLENELLWYQATAADNIGGR